MKSKLILIFSFLFLLVNFSCEVLEKSEDKEIISFSINNVKAVISNNNITLTLPFNTNLTNLVAGFQTTGDKVTVSGVEQISGITPNNFISPVTYTIVAEDESSKEYVVTVSTALSSDKDISLFEISSQATPTSFSNTSISFKMPYNADLTNLVAVFNITGVKILVNSVEQVSGQTSNNFSNPVKYTVVAADNSTKNYTVTIIKTLSTEKDITSFNIPNRVSVNINQANSKIDVLMPYNTSLENLVASFTASGVSVTVDGDVQVSGVTANDFSENLVYIVHAADGSTKNYSVNVTRELSPLNSITSFIFNNHLSSIIDGSAGIITVTMPEGTNPNNLVAIFETTGQVLKIGQAQQVSGSTSNNFTNPLTYTVYAENGSTKSYIVNVNIVLASTKDLLTFNIPNQIGATTFSGNNINILMPYQTQLNGLISNFASNGVSVKVNNIEQTSGVTSNDFTTPITYVIHAEDGTTNSYQVTVSIQQSNDDKFLSFNLPEQKYSYIYNTSNTVKIRNYGINPSELIPAFTTNGVSVKVNGIDQISGVTPQNFTSNVVYTVKAQNGSQRNYSVSIEMSYTYFDTTSKYIRIHNRTDEKIYFTILPAPVGNMGSSEIADFEYCFNYKDYTSNPLSSNQNDDLTKIEQFDCEGKWKPYDEIPTSLQIESSKRYFINFLVKNTSTNEMFIYQRAYVDKNLIVLPIGATCENLISNIESNKSILIRNNLNCEGLIINNTSTISNLNINGNGYAISNLNISNTNDGVGLFGSSIQNSYILNLNISNATIEGNDRVGIIAGTINNSSIESISISNSNISGNKYIGAFSGEINGNTSVKNIEVNSTNVYSNVGYNGTLTGKFITDNSTISNYKCIGSGLVKTINNTYYTAYTGGLIGYLEGVAVIEDVNCVISVDAHQRVGGLIGQTKSNNGKITIKNSYVQSNIIAKYGVGGYIGKVEDSIEILECDAISTIDALQNVGGLIGQITNPVSYDTLISDNVTSVTFVNASGGPAGGLIGREDISNPSKNIKIINNVTSGSIIGRLYLGGFVGMGSEDVFTKNNFSSVNINSSNGEEIGGFFGRLSGNTIGKIENNIAAGSVKGRRLVGGFIGDSQFLSIQNNIATGNVEGDEWGIGGFIGRLDGADLIKNCYSTGSVTGDSNVGGFIGELKYQHSGVINTLFNSYSSGSVSGATDINGFIGEYIFKNNDVLYNNYCLTPDSHTNIVTQLSQTQFGEQASFVGFDFDTVWIMKDGTGPEIRRPHLKFEED